MKDYKDTLNLPKTDFPMRANLPQREPDILKYWQDINLYEQQRAQRKNRDKFILHDGPPYANGKIHMGTGFNKILKDIVVKSKILSGYDSPYVPGWDCHGLPIEINVEKKIGKAGDKVTREEFLKACRNYAKEQMNIQRAGFKRLGVVGDWNNPYLTMDFKYEANVVRALAKIHANGYIVHGKKPVHWCTACGSALAEAEVEYKDKSTPAIDVRFKVIDKNKFISSLGINLKTDTNIVVPIWTTTPWTLPANQAVALNAKLEYSLVKTANEYFLIATNLLSSVMQRYKINNYSVVATCLGEKLEDTLLQHPFLDRQVPIILGEHVTIEAGTGAVHTAPGHGLEDYLVATRYNLPIENPVDTKGCFLPNTKFFAGEYVFKANDHIIKVLQENGNLIHLETIQHSYPHCWRHKTPLIFRATPQWFISMDKNGLRDKTLTEIEK
ncbi:MAG: class I tRNA ligase family protein, partial [Hydrotalea flava]|nr:class I tRNA ligase family protein [Hydrotalea flava]NIN14978.1 class I tRNA ligase family protein [Hydrotalea flava]NIO94046.1 class I tRNA ligase family protein [Hydrotalea flava]NIS92884.1 class I tRNA ligase family protein [Hydrotalea flava]NIT19418.1 class I tRNA ligase family protein [Hydrotalea flava]